MVARIFRGPDGSRDVAEAGRGRTFETPFSVVVTAEPAVNSRPTTRFARKPPEGGWVDTAVHPYTVPPEAHGTREVET